MQPDGKTLWKHTLDATPVAGSVSLVPALEPRKLQDLQGGPSATARAYFL